VSLVGIPNFDTEIDTKAAERLYSSLRERCRKRYSQQTDE
jgi:hypothetical protein